MTSEDIDGDGDNDIIASANNIIFWYENRSGIFVENEVGTDSNSSPSYRSYTKTKDIDNDGDIDVITANLGNGSGGFYWYENKDGLGDFRPKTRYTYGGILSSNTQSLGIGDIDGDKDYDVVLSNSTYGEVFWFANTDALGNYGNQMLAHQNDKSISHETSNVILSDVDMDGDLDIVFSLQKKNDTSLFQVLWVENLDGQGDFGTGQIIADISIDNVIGITSISQSDIDKDGDFDYVVTLVDKVLWYENIGVNKNEINGNIKLDINSIGCASENPHITNFKVVTSDGVNTLLTFPQSHGAFQLFPGEGDFSTTVIHKLSNYYGVTPNSYSLTFSGLGNTETINFCVEPNQIISDINISLVPEIQARPGFDTRYQLVFHNVGTTQLNGSVLIEFDDSKLSFLSANETITSQTTNSLIFNYSNLNPFETRTIDLDFNVLAPPTTEIGDTLTFTATINPVSEDNTESDNIFVLNQTVVGSYDPNDIVVLEGNEILFEEVDDYLHYIIRFQNTGTADAINVRIDNILDPNLDWDSIQLESYSHSNRVEIKDGNQVSFIFNGIYLPGNTADEPNSHGFVAYKIKPKKGIETGGIMQNKADIYFDFNLPIITNTVSTQVANVLSASESSPSNFKIFPNPTKGILNVTSQSQIIRLEIYNNLGQVIASQFNKTRIDVSVLNSGIYFIKIEDETGNCEIKKIIKK